MLDSLRFVKYVRSFMDGRVRVRHPALRDAAIAGKARAALLRGRRAGYRTQYPERFGPHPL